MIQTWKSASQKLIDKEDFQVQGSQKDPGREQATDSHVRAEMKSL